MPRFIFHLSLAWIGLFPVGTVLAQSVSADQEDSTARYQITYNAQKHGAFRSLMPDGPNSLASHRDYMYTFSATAHWGKRLATDTELYFNPEVVQGVPFSNNLVGLGGFTNGEITRAAGTTPHPYLQRLFWRKTWNEGGAREWLDADFNQMARWVDSNRFVLTAGNFSVLDVFDDNAYAKDPRGMQRPEYDRALEGLSASKRLLLPANRLVEVDRMLRLAADVKQPTLLYGGIEAYRPEVAELLKKNNTA